MFDLKNYVDFPTHISGLSLDPVVTDLPDTVVTTGMPRPLLPRAVCTTLAVPAREEEEEEEDPVRTTWSWHEGGSGSHCTWSFMRPTGHLKCTVTSEDKRLPSLATSQPLRTDVYPSGSESPSHKSWLDTFVERWRTGSI